MATTAEATFTCTLGDDELLFRRMVGREELGRLSEYRLELMRPQKHDPIDPEDLLGTQATVKLLRTNQEHRYINGWITSVEIGGAAGRFDLYHVMLRPWLWHLTLGSDCRIFQDKSALEIIQAVFGDYSSAQVDTSKLTGTLRSRPYCVQYRESDFNFVSRLMEEEGIWYYFTHAENQHTLVLANAKSAHVALPEATLGWSPQQKDDQTREDVVTQWRRAQRLRSLKFTHDDYDYESPTTSLLKSDTRTTKYPNPGDLEVYDWPGTYTWPADAKNADQGDFGAKLEVRRLESGHVYAQAATPCRSVGAGMTFTLEDHPWHAGDYLITAAHIEIDIGDSEATEATRGFGVRSRLQLVPKDVDFVSDALTRKPFVQGPQTATVVGPSGDEIHVDRLGRVKVHFRWDRVGQKNEQDTCYIRVATPWASKGYGMITTPRIGDEVVVSFLEGDPDRPLITGSVYNGDNLPPYELPAQATVYGIRSRSTKQGAATNFNELRFDDKKGSEYIWFQAEKDRHGLVKNDATDEVTRDNQTKIGRDHKGSVGNNYDFKIGNVAKVEVAADASVKVGGDLNSEVTGAFGLKVGSDVDIKGGAAVKLSSGAAMDINSGAAITITGSAAVHITGSGGVVIDGASSLTIKAGSGSVVLDGGGVSITGGTVKINSGGSAGSANSAAEASPTAPEAPADTVDVPDPLA